MTYRCNLLDEKFTVFLRTMNITMIYGLHELVLAHPGLDPISLLDSNCKRFLFFTLTLWSNDKKKQTKMRDNDLGDPTILVLCPPLRPRLLRQMLVLGRVDFIHTLSVPDVSKGDPRSVPGTGDR